MRATMKKVVALDFGAGAETAERHDGADAGLVGPKGTALLVTNDSLSQQWAPRWLKQVGLGVQMTSSPDEALAIARDSRPNLMIVDAAMKSTKKQPLLEALRQIHGDKVPLIALCGGNAETVIAAEADATDIVRRPFDWDVITRRAIRAVNMHEAMAQLRSTQVRLHRANAAASAAKRKRKKSAGLDQLTRLPTGRRFRSLLHKATAGHDDSAMDLCLLVIGLDNFRLVNDAIGYENGSRLLRQFADRLRDCLRDPRVIGGPERGSVTACAGRLGGARFALLISADDADQVVRAREIITELLNAPFEVGGQSIYLNASIGAAVYPRDSSSADALIYNAESAMYLAQEAGSGFEFHTKPSDTSSQRILELDGMLREAVRNDELTLAYQPIIDTESGTVVAAEALLRWQHSTEGEISPADFVPVAERSGMMLEIGSCVIRRACAQLRDWLDAGMQPLRMAVNLSLCQLLRGDVTATVAAALEEHRLDPALLELELSERGVLNQRREVIAQVHRLKALGVRISIDDFGTGNSAIGYLKDLPIDVIKIDRSYVSGADSNARNDALASGMTALARGLDATVIAEGVETEEQRKRADAWGAQEFQGFYCSAAVSGEEFLGRFG